MERHAKELQVKAKNHTVDLTRHHEIFEVESFISGKMYSVRFLGDESLICSCEWSKYYPRKLCSHRMAVLDWCEKAGLRTLSFWKTEEDAIRQHRPYYMVENGLWVTSRKTHSPKVQELIETEPEPELTATKAYMELFDDRDTAILASAPRGRSKLFK